MSAFDTLYTRNDSSVALLAPLDQQTIENHQALLIISTAFVVPCTPLQREGTSVCRPVTTARVATFSRHSLMPGVNLMP